jgi:hypothetical protein
MDEVKPDEKLVLSRRQPTYRMPVEDLMIEVFSHGRGFLERDAERA